MSAGCAPGSVPRLGCGGLWLGTPRGPGPIGGSCVSLGALTRWWVPWRFGMLRMEFVLIRGMCAGSCPLIRSELRPSMPNWGALSEEGMSSFSKKRIGPLAAAAQWGGLFSAAQVAHSVARVGPRGGPQGGVAVVVPFPHKVIGTR